MSQSELSPVEVVIHALTQQPVSHRLPKSKDGVHELKGLLLVIFPDGEMAIGVEGQPDMWAALPRY